MFKLHLMMSFADRRRWRSARTAADLGELTAQWLESRIASRPGYTPGHGPDSETTDSPALLAALLLCNRGGFVTESSQPGFRGMGADGHWRRQRAAVQGFTNDPDVLAVLRGVAEQHGLMIRVYGRGSLSLALGAVVVTERDERPHTKFGRSLASEDVIRIWRGAGYRAIHAMHRAWQVTLIDPAFGERDLLWRVLTEAFTGPSSCPRCGCTPYEPCHDGCCLTTHGTETLCSTCAYGRPGLDAPDDFGDGDQDDFEDFDGEPAESECDLCGAPFHGSRRYCTQACEDADAPEPDSTDQADSGAETEVEHFTVLSEDPWTTAPRT
ncbi:hypothetical protein AB0O91_36635 [Kitasatospora sp. NPDC089797]|uniref:DUF6919 domain-containing protein n=1 Tax=Kitasatospora sp. NPDC089797 TaxID=3155298 RepID=UPI003417C5EA